jgi:hypothetical protein
VEHAWEFSYVTTYFENIAIPPQIFYYDSLWEVYTYCVHFHHFLFNIKITLKRQKINT